MQIPASNIEWQLAARLCTNCPPFQVNKVVVIMPYIGHVFTNKHRVCKAKNEKRSDSTNQV